MYQVRWKFNNNFKDWSVNYIIIEKGNDRDKKYSSVLLKIENIKDFVKESGLQNIPILNQGG